MRRRPALALAVAVAVAACGGGAPPQPDPAWIADAAARAAPIASLDLAADDADLAFLDGVLAGRRFVGLGESSHGVGQYGAAKARLVKYLHEHLGFDVLVFESSILSMYLAERDADALTARARLEHGIHWVWWTEDVLALVAYAQATRATEHPLVLAGMDVSFSGPDEAARRPALFGEVVAKIDPVYAAEVEAMDAELAENVWGLWLSRGLTDAQLRWLAEHQADLRPRYGALADFLGEHMAELQAAYPADPLLPVVLRRAALSTRAFAEVDPGVFARTRDRDMADTFELVATELYPGRKYMVWAHDAHLYRAGAEASGGHTGYAAAGQWLAERHGGEYYMLSLLMHHGRSGDSARVPFSIDPAPAWSIEGILHAAGASVAFLDLAGAPPAPERAWIDEPFVWREWGLDDIRAVPRRQMDGVLYFDAVDPPAYLEEE